MEKGIMIEKIKNLPENVIGFNAIDHVTGDDYEKILIPLVEKKLKKFDKLNLIYHIGEEFEKFEPRAMWDDAKVGFEHIHSWGKIAMVSDVSWIRGMTKFFAFMFPCKVKIFKNDQLDEAVKWVSE